MTYPVRPVRHGVQSVEPERGGRRFPALLGIAGLVATAGCQGPVDNGAVSGEQPAKAAVAVEMSTWGKRVTWKDGLAIEVSAPVVCTPGQFASPPSIERAMRFTVTVANDAAEAFETAGLGVGGTARFDGQKAQPVFDANGDCGHGGIESSTVLPGSTFTYAVAFAVSAQQGEMRLVFQPDSGANKAIFVGQA